MVIFKVIMMRALSMVEQAKLEHDLKEIARLSDIPDEDDYAAEDDEQEDEEWEDEEDNR